MSVTDYFENFLGILEEAENAPVVAPFNLTENGDNKIVFKTCRAKNFRSIGNEFLSLDFNRNKSTLIVSDDNGSGKSTLAVWAPYFALTGKPYAPSEKIGALVNSSTKKDCLVEIEFFTKGQEYLVRRGYKPSIFEIYKLENSGWCKIDEEASRGDQQKFLESILGFDARILENVMILGIDKYTPFVEMGAPARRHVVETIWDLAIFPIMLDLAKKEFAISERKFQEASIECDKVNTELKHVSELAAELENVKSSIEKKTLEITELSQRKENLTSEMQKCETEFPSTVQGLGEKLTSGERALASKKASFDSDCDAELLGVQEELRTTRENVDSLVAGVSTNFQTQLTQIETELEGLEAADAEESSKVKSELIATYQQLQQELADNERLALEEENKIRASRKHEDHVKVPDDVETLKLEISKMEKDEEDVKKVIESLTVEEKSLNSELGYFKTEVQGHETAIKHKREAKTVLDQKVQKLRHIGTCPTCSQLVTEEVVDSVIKAMGEDFKRVDTSEEERLLVELASSISSKQSEINDCLSQQEKMKGVLRGCLDNKQLNINLKDKKMDEYYAAVTQFNLETQALVTDAKAAIIRETKEKLAAHSTNSQFVLSQVKAKYAEWKAPLKTKLATIQSEQRAEVSRVRMEEQSKIDGLENKIKNIKEVFNNRFLEETTDLRNEISEVKAAIQSAKNLHSERLNKYRAQIGEVENSLTKLRIEVSESEKYYNEKSKGYGDRKQTLENKHTELSETLNSLDEKLNSSRFIINELGDKAAKADIIKAYLPFLNGKINEYLEAMNLFVGFKMDENFNVDFTSPDRSGQTTASLSKGQLARMNLSVLFALRDVANLKASVNSNILVLDEILEPLSARGVKEVTEMINHKFQNMNIFVVSQRADEFSEHFQHTITYGLRGGFTSVL